jgi:hypothetical protein
MFILLVAYCTYTDAYVTEHFGVGSWLHLDGTYWNWCFGIGYTPVFIRFTYE